MAIVQISKILQRSGNIVDLPQLDNAELGWASDARRLFVGNDNNITGVENVEVLTSYSTIDFDQLNGSTGNLNIDANTLAEGQVLAYDGNNWVNRGGDAPGLLTLGDVGNVKIEGGAIGYVLETDGTGNLSWTPKGTLVAYIKDASAANPCVITTTQDNFFTEGQEVTFTNLPGVSGSVGNGLNGLSLYANILTSNTFALYTDSGLTTGYNTTGNTSFPYTSATATSSSNDQVTVGDATLFTVNDAVTFVGDTDFGNSNIVEGQTYYVLTKDTSVPNTWVTLSETVGGSTLQLGTATFTANLYASSGRAIAAVGGAGSTVSGGSNTTVQFNNNNLLDGNSSFTFDYAASPPVMTVVGNANVSNLNASTMVTAPRLTSNIATGTAPLVVSSTTRVANLNVNYANVSDFEVVTQQTTGTFYPVFVNGSSTANYALGANANISFNAATGNLSTILLNVTSNANVANLGASGLIVATGNVTGGNLVTAGVANVTGNVTGGNLVTSGVANVTGNVIGGNINTAGNVTASRLISNVATGTAPLTVTSTTRVANLNVNYANVSDFEVVTTQTTGVFYPTFVNSSATGNLALGANANLSFNAATGALSATLLIGTLTTAAQPNVTSLGTLTSLTVTGNITSGNANLGNTVTANYFIGNFYGTANSATIATTAGTVTTNAQPNITSVGTLTSLAVSGNISGGNLNSAGKVVASTLESNVITGTSPLTVASTTKVTNLNADLLDGFDTATAATANTVVVRDPNGNITGNNISGTLTTSSQTNITSLGTLTGLIVSGTANLNTTLTTLLTSGSNVTNGTLTGNWTLSSGSRLQATYADLAENYVADDNYETGTVLEFGGTHEVTLASDATNKVAGVVSSEPAYVMNSNCQGEFVVPIALQGRVPVKVRGKIQKGDMMISGGNGYARPTSNPQTGTIIGKSLENFEGIGIIEIAVGRL